MLIPPVGRPTDLGIDRFLNTPFEATGVFVWAGQARSRWSDVTDRMALAPQMRPLVAPHAATLDRVLFTFERLHALSDYGPALSAVDPRGFTFPGWFSEKVLEARDRGFDTLGVSKDASDLDRYVARWLYIPPQHRSGAGGPFYDWLYIACTVWAREDPLGAHVGTQADAGPSLMWMFANAQAQLPGIRASARRGWIHQRDLLGPQMLDSVRTQFDAADRAAAAVKGLQKHPLPPMPKSPSKTGPDRVGKW